MPPSSIADISCSPESLEADLIAGETDPRDPATWLGRRAYGFGASEAHALLVIAGRRSADTAPRWMREEMIADTRTRLGTMPMLHARKLGLRKPQRRKRVTDLGTERERAVFAGFVAMAEAYDLDPSTCAHASSMPVEWMPLVDRLCPQLASSPDGWARDIYDGSLVVLEVKCSYEPYMHRYHGCPPHYESQVQARNGAEGAARGVLVEGVGWARERHDGAIVGWDVARNEGVIAEIREAAREQWKRIEELRKGRGA